MRDWNLKPNLSESRCIFLATSLHHPKPGRAKQHVTLAKEEISEVNPYRPNITDKEAEIKNSQMIMSRIRT